MQYKRGAILLIIFICCLGVDECGPEWETYTITIYRNPNGTAKMTLQLSNIVAGEDASEEDLKRVYQSLISMFEAEESALSEGLKLNYNKIWINEDGFLELLAEFEGSEQEIFKGPISVNVKEDTMMTILAKSASDVLNVATNGEKIIDGDDLIIQWPIQARILKVSAISRHVPYKVDWLVDFFIQRNPKGFVEKHFD